MFGFIKKNFVVVISFFIRITRSITSLSASPLKCVSMNNQECKVRPEIVNVNSDKPVFYPFNIKTSKCSGSCSTINDSYQNCALLMLLKTCESI